MCMWEYNIKIISSTSLKSSYLKLGVNAFEWRNFPLVTEQQREKWVQFHCITGSNVLADHSSVLDLLNKANWSFGKLYRWLKRQHLKVTKLQCHSAARLVGTRKRDQSHITTSGSILLWLTDSYFCLLLQLLSKFLSEPNLKRKKKNPNYYHNICVLSSLLPFSYINRTYNSSRPFCENEIFTVQWG